jgi:hypothetical protein
MEKQTMIRGEGWFDQECAEVTDKMNIAYMMMVQRWFTRVAKEEYTETRREEKKMHKIKKREYYEELKWTDDSKQEAVSRSRKIYKQVNTMREGFWGKRTGCRNAGETVTNKRTQWSGG